MAALQYQKMPRFQDLSICAFADRAGNLLRYRTLPSVTPGWRARVYPSMPVIGARSREPAVENATFRARRNWSVGSWTGGRSDGCRLALGDAGAWHIHPRRHAATRNGARRMPLVARSAWGGIAGPRL